MRIDRIENNRAILSGEIVSNFEFSHEVYGEKFYNAFIATERQSGEKDVIPVTVSERLVDVKEDRIGRFAEVYGQFRSYNKHDGEKTHLILFMFARKFKEIEGLPLRNDKNSIFLDGYICKKPVYRKTPFGREIADLLMAVNRPYGKSDYIHCICWGRNAHYADGFEAGEHIQLWGRIQSREYQKQISDGEYETRVAYEVSAGKMVEVMEEQETEAVE